ncbi:hypothetical protein [Streptomyces sp. 4F14]|uniref:hypothetical protein n=1 Tax=Streptomyces sp. 4F14 TaxID=3394380 RepID=UPI003A83F52C
MAEGEAVAGSGVRVRLDGSRGDVGALKAWLEREEPLGRLVREGKLRIEERARGGEGREHMGVELELVLQLVEGVVATGTLLGWTKRSVDSWKENRRQVERGTTLPEPRVEPFSGPRAEPFSGPRAEPLSEPPSGPRAEPLPDPRIEPPSDPLDPDRE